MKRAVFLVSAIWAAAAAVAQDHLTPEPGPLAVEREYYTKVREVFAEVYRSHVVLMVVFFPAFELEEIAGIRKTEHGFEAFASKPSSQIQETYSIYEAEKQSQGKPLNPDSPLAEMKKQFPSNFREITVHTDSRTISAPLTERTRRIWQKMLLAARHPKNPMLGSDGETFHFSMWIQNHGVVSGEVWSPDRGTRMRALTNLADGLVDYARGNADEKKLTELLKPLER